MYQVPWGCKSKQNEPCPFFVVLTLLCQRPIAQDRSWSHKINTCMVLRLVVSWLDTYRFTVIFSPFLRWKVSWRPGWLWNHYIPKNGLVFLILLPPTPEVGVTSVQFIWCYESNPRLWACFASTCTKWTTNHLHSYDPGRPNTHAVVWFLLL